MAVIKTRINKSDANILTDIQAFTDKVTAFAFVSGNPEVTYSEAPTVREESRISFYFDNQDHRTWS